jgi:hypothetical protein
VALYLHRPDKGPLSDPELIWGTIGFMILAVARFAPVRLFAFYACPFRVMTGIPCFSCGMTRTFVFMARGNISEALSLNPLGTALFVFILLFVIYAAIVIAFRLPRVRIRITRPWIRWTLRLGIPAIILANWIHLLLVDR